VGYAGGTTPAPTYEAMGDHTETIQIDFDPTQISYQELLDVFWATHSPGPTSWSRQYRSVILVAGDAQRALAEASLAARGEVSTTVEPLGPFTRAEDYHQKYTLRHWKPILAELKRAYPDERDLVDSTAAARLNGYLAGKGSPAQLERELASLGLSQAAADTVQERVGVR
jgi:peptide methionine sulfoxide reductase MsrA